MRSELSSDSQSASSDGTYAEPSRSCASTFVPENGAAVNVRSSRRPGVESVGIDGAGAAVYDRASCGALAPWRLEYATRSLELPVRVKEYSPPVLTVLVTSNSTHCPSGALRVAPSEDPLVAGLLFQVMP